MTIAVDLGRKTTNKLMNLSMCRIEMSLCRISFLILIKFTYLFTGMLAIIEYYELGIEQPQQKL